MTSTDASRSATALLAIVLAIGGGSVLAFLRTGHVTWLPAGVGAALAVWLIGVRVLRAQEPAPAFTERSAPPARARRAKVFALALAAALGGVLLFALTGEPVTLIVSLIGMLGVAALRHQYERGERSPAMALTWKRVTCRHCDTVNPKDAGACAYCGQALPA